MTGAADPVSRVRAALAAPAVATSDFDLNPEITLPEGRVLRPAAVLMGVQGEGTDARILLTKRSSRLAHHPGQIAFPGGKMDDTDADLTATALREAQEETGLEPGQVEVLGQMPTHETVTSFSVTPVVARIPDFDPVVEPGEVEFAFTVPLSFVLDADNYLVESRIWQGRRRYYFAVPYGPFYIWGATARMLRGLAGLVPRA